MGSVSLDKISLLRSLEPFLTVRHYYALAVRHGLVNRSLVRSVIGHDYKRVLNGAVNAMKRIDPKRSPMLRPPNVWDDELEYAASITSSFGRKLINHGIRPTEVSLLTEERLENYSRLRLMGLDQKEACIRNGSPRKLSLDDEVVHKLQVKKFGYFKRDNKVSVRWTRGAVKAYSKMKNGHGGCIINKCGLPRRSLVTESRDSFGIGNAIETCRRMAVVSQRVLRVFTQSLLGREMLEFSELTPDEFDAILPNVSLEDWRIISRGDGTFLRCYWKLKLKEGVKWVKTQRSELDSGCLISSIDISASTL
jgi:hypothetical protein